MAPGYSKRPRRCYWYDEDGEPRVRDNGVAGCQWNGCSFVHPSESDWHKATTTRHPGDMRSAPEQERYEEERKRERDRERERRILERERECAQDKERQRALDKSPDRMPLSSPSTSYNSGASTRDPRRGSLPSISTGRAPSPITPIAASPSVPRALSLGNISAGPSSSSNLPSASSVADPRRRSVDSRQDSRGGPPRSRSPTSRRPSSPGSSTMPPPALPYMSRRSPAQERKGRTREEVLQTWIARIKQMAEAVTIRTQYVALEKELTSLRALASSRGYSGLSEVARDRLDKQYTDTDRAFNAKKQELNSLVFKLVDSDFWPVPPVHPDFHERGEDARQKTAEDRFQELRTTVWTLSEGVKELHGLVKTVQNAQTISPSVSLSSTQDAGGDQRPGKRRRLSDSEGQPQAVAVPTVPLPPQMPPPAIPATPQVPAAAHEAPQIASSSSRPMPPPAPPTVSSVEIDGVKDKLEELEGQINDLENSMIQFNDEILMELESRIDDKLEDKLKKMNLSEMFPDAAQQEDAMQVDGPDAGQSAPVTTKTRIQRLETEVIQVGKDIDGLVQKLVEIVTGAQEAKQRIEWLTKENLELKARINELETKQEVNATKMSELQTQLVTVHSALTTFMAERRHREEKEANTTVKIHEQALDRISANVDSIVLASVRTNVSASLDEQRAIVQNMLDEHGAQLSQNLLGKLTVALRAVSTINRWMSSMAEGEDSGSSDGRNPMSPS